MVEWRDVIYTVDYPTKDEPLEMKLWTRYFFTENKILQITFTSEVNKFDGRLDDFKFILDSFELK